MKFNPERIKYWMSVGALPSENVAIFLKKYMDKFEKAEAEAAVASPGANTPGSPAPGNTPGSPAPAATEASS